MSVSLRVRRRALIFILGSAATGTIAQPAAAQQSGNGTDNSEPATDGGTNATDDEQGTEPDAEQDAEPLGPRLDLDCYVLSVDGDSYAGVELRFVDGTTVTFEDDYDGVTLFGYSGDGRLDPGDETAVAEFHGPIAWATVVVGNATETVTNSGRCPFGDLVFDCDSAAFSRGNDVRMRFVDGSVKRWDPPADPDQTQFGSPGRVVESAREESADIEVANPNLDCEPGDYATVFDCTEVTVGPEEFAAEPTFDRAILTFVDGSTESFGPQGDESGFTAPETFAGTGDNAGTVIESLGIEKRDGDIAFRLVNPTVDDCEPAAADDSEAASADGDGAAANETNSTAGGAGGDDEGDTGEPRSGPPGTDSASTGGRESTGGDEAADSGESAVDDEVGSQLPWWSWTAAAGGAAGTVSYLVSRTLGGSETVDAAGEEGDRSASVDEPPNRWDRFGNR